MASGGRQAPVGRRERGADVPRSPAFGTDSELRRQGVARSLLRGYYLGYTAKPVLPEPFGPELPRSLLTAALPDASKTMVQLCKQCRRVNPPEAVYCWHDGVRLEHRAGGDGVADGGAIDVGTQPFTAPFVFPSGTRCGNLQQLAEACHREREEIFPLFQEGYLEAFLAAQGRSDLAGAARAAARAADRQRGLDDFLGRLPARLAPAKLRVEPAALDFGTVRVGEDRRVELVLRNEGKRLLYGSAVCEADWLCLGDGPPQPRKLFQCSNKMVLPVRILGRRLRALDKPQETTILLESSGGNATIAIRMHVPVQPFPEGVLAGALSPRQLAKKAHEAPREAAILIENGTVARWYEANGWTYPVLGPAASGMAAVQQLFEALGLVKVPAVELSEDAIHLRGLPGEQVEYALAVITRENRAAIAHGSSDQPWLQVGKPIFRGRSAFLPLRVAAVPGRPGETLQAILSVAANGGQRFRVPVTLAVGESGRAMSAAAPSPPRPLQAPAAQPVPPPLPVAALASAPVAVAVATQPAIDLPPPSPPIPLPQGERGVRAPMHVPAPAAVVPQPPAVPGGSTGGRARLRTSLPAVLLVAVAIGGVLRDWLASGDQAVPNESVQPADSTPRLDIRFHQDPRDDVLETLYLPGHRATMRFGLVMLRGGRPIGSGIGVRRLTFDPWGRTNNTCLRFEGKDERLFGSGDKGHWEDSDIKGWKDEQGQEHDGVQSVWAWDDKRVAVTQYVELVRGQQSGLLDTCRVRYRIDNRDSREHKIGIRFLLDTFIGGNDGVPFTIPGEPDLCDTMMDLPAQSRTKAIPAFLQALEKPDLAHPGTIAHLRLNLEKLEPPVRVTLGAWPNEKLRVLDRNANGPLTLWNVPLLPLKSLQLDDSAVAIYWKEKALEGRGKREVGFEYGLWNLASAGSRLATTVDGAFRPGGQLTVVAYVNRAGRENEDESLTLKLPESFRLLGGEQQTQRVPRLPPNAKSANVPITWRVQVGSNTGSYQFRVESNLGVSQVLRVTIRQTIY
jgi:hypothetical protein